MGMQKNSSPGIKVIWFIFFWYATLPFGATFSLGAIGGMEFTASRTAGILVVLFLSALLPFSPINRIPRHLLWTTLVLIGYMFLHIFLGDSWIADLGVFIRAYGSFALTLYMICVLDETGEKLVSSLLLWLAILTASYTITQATLFAIDPALAIDIFGTQAFWGQGSKTVRPGGLLLSPGGSASIMSIGILILLKQYLYGETNVSSICKLSLIVFGLGLNFTRTFVFLLILFIPLVLIRYSRWQGVFAFSLIGLLAIGAMVNILGEERFINRFHDIPGFAEAKDEERYFEGRTMLVEIVMDSYKQEALLEQILGHDYRWPSRKIEAYYEKKFGLDIGESSTHNDFMWLLSVLGALGILLYALFCLSLLTSIKGEYAFFGQLFVGAFYVMSGLGGESIPIVGHRYLQAMYIAMLISEGMRECQPDDYSEIDGNVKRE